MKAQPQFSSRAEHAGAAAGRAWRGWLRQEERLAVWCVSKGLPATMADTLLRIVTVALLFVLLYTAFWIALLLVLTTAAAWGIRDADPSNEPDASALGEQVDHRMSVFYDPINHNDDPDPRFEGE